MEGPGRIVLDCSACAFSRDLTDEIDAYVEAMEHELDNPDHFVFVGRRE